MCRASLWPLLLSCRAMNLLDHIASKINITFYSWVDWYNIGCCYTALQCWQEGGRGFEKECALFPFIFCSPSMESPILSDMLEQHVFL
jgi:hypothetical protein